MMHSFIAIACAALLSITLTAALPSELYPYRSTGLDLSSSALVGPEVKDYSDEAYPSTEIEMATAAYTCATGLAFACCEEHADTFFNPQGKPDPKFLIYTCGRDQDGCTAKLEDTRRCCRKREGGYLDFEDDSRAFAVCAAPVTEYTFGTPPLTKET